MRTRNLAQVSLAAALLPAAFHLPVLAQQPAAQEPQPRFVTMTTFSVPIQDRETVQPFVRDFVIPGFQLNPKVLNFRVLVHNWGSRAGEVVFLAEYASFADINAECGQPCDDYFARHEPREGTPERAEWEEAQALFQKYYSEHRDEIYAAPLPPMKVEGRLMGTVGPPPAGN